MTFESIDRRRFLGTAAATGLAALAAPRFLPAKESKEHKAHEARVPYRVITQGPKHHWFGYYDKLEFDPSGRHCLGMQVDFEHRTPKPSDVIRVGMVDLQDGDRWIEIGESSAWGWQQGCMLQWVPGSKSKILWNDRDTEAGRYVCRIHDVQTQQTRTVPSPIYALSPDGKTAVAADFRRIQEVRPGYGYVGLPDPHRDELAPQDSGIFKVDLESGEAKLIVSLADAVDFVRPGQDLRAGEGKSSKHWFNHLLFNPDGSRFVFLHRRTNPDGRGWQTRMLTADPDGRDLRILDDNGLTSHFIWKDPRQILAWSRQKSHGAAFYLFDDADNPDPQPVGEKVMTRDGHCTYLPGGEWIVNDTYPDGGRFQTVYLYHPQSGRRIELGRFHSPPEYTGEWRCDTHPRHSPDGTKLVIDSPYNGTGRQLHLIDISDVI